jgi:hypothetical protein
VPEARLPERPGNTAAGRTHHVIVLQCVDAINSGDGTIEEVQKARVQSHPDLKGKTDVK